MPATIYALPAIGTTPEMWNPVQAIAPDLPLVAADPLAMLQRCDRTLEGLVAALLAQLPPGPLVLTGTSFGGQLALELAARLGERVRCTVLIAPGPAELDQAFLERARGLERMLEHTFTGEMLDSMLPLLSYPFGPNYAEAAKLLRSMLSVAAVRSLPLVKMAPAFHHASELLPRIHGSVRVLLGTANGNPVTGTGLAESWRRAVGPDAVELVEGAAEFISLDRPEVVAGALRDALAEGADVRRTAGG